MNTKQKMKQEMPVGCVVMAAGDSSRFGENKLMVQLDGKTMIQRALDAVPPDRLASVCVVTQYAEIASMAREYGFRFVYNHHPERGISYTVRLGTEKLKSRCRAIIFLVADQPLLQRQSVEALLDCFIRNPERIVAASRGGVRGNPCIFPERFFSELCALSGDVGGSAVIRRHEEDLLLLEVGEEELTDVDTPDALDQLRK